MSDCTVENVTCKGVQPISCKQGHRADPGERSCIGPPSCLNTFVWLSSVLSSIVKTVISLCGTPTVRWARLNWHAGSALIDQRAAEPAGNAIAMGCSILPETHALSLHALEHACSVVQLSSSCQSRGPCIHLALHHEPWCRLPGPTSTVPLPSQIGTNHSALTVSH